MGKTINLKALRRKKKTTKQNKTKQKQTNKQTKTKQQKTTKGRNRIAKIG